MNAIQPSYVPRVSERATTCRMFENDVLERFSRIHPLTPFVFWLPIVGLLMYRSVSRDHASWGLTFVLPLMGFLAWGLAEYILHRWVFHWTNGTRWADRVHFILHGVHHDFPSDKDRLVMPLGASIPLAILFYALFHFIFAGVTLAEPFLAGFIVGYLRYDGSHYALHHFNWKFSLFRKLKHHHMLHHHVDHDGAFGVSTPFWDHIFRTMPTIKKRAN